MGEALGKLLVHPTIASKRWVWQQYDHMVMSGCTVEPGSDAGVVRLSIAGIDKYLAIANDCNNRFCFLDPYKGAQIAFAECMRNLACSGARALAVTDNLNFANPNKPEAYHMLKECVKGLADACSFFDVPVVGGNVSLYNEHGQGAIDPTPVVSMVGLIDDAKQVTQVSSPSGAIRSSYRRSSSRTRGQLLSADTIRKRRSRSRDRLVRGEKSSGLSLCSHFERIGPRRSRCFGGWAFGCAEMLWGNRLASLFDSHGPSGRLDSLLFGESQGRVLLAVSAERQENVLLAAEESGLAAQVLGSADESGRLKISMAGEEILDASVSSLRESWSQAIPNYMK